jgi:hypothetical protein
VIAVYDGVNYGSIETGYRQLCSRCFNEEIARAGGLHFQHVQFEAVEMHDAGGERHDAPRRGRVDTQPRARRSLRLNALTSKRFGFPLFSPSINDPARNAAGKTRPTQR